MNEIVGLPSIVSSRLRIVIDIAFRRIVGIPENGSVQVLICKNQLLVFPASSPVPGSVRKEVSIGRFNLPVEWASRNHVEVGDRVQLFATEDYVIIRPQIKNLLGYNTGP